MTIPINEAVIKYQEYVNVVHKARARISEDFEIVESNKFELGAEWLILLQKKPIGEFMWNVPHMLSFKPLVDQPEQAYDEDYIKDINLWTEVIENTVSSILSTKSGD